MIDFSEDVTFKLRKVDNHNINKNASAMLIDDEEVIGVYKTVRDQVVFTDKRIIAIDVKGITGKRQELFILPYTNIQYFGVQTVGFFELIPDSELSLFFNNGMAANFEFRGESDIIEIGKVISQFTLKK